MSHHADLIQLARQVELYRRQRRFDLGQSQLAALVDRVLRRDPRDIDALRVRRVLQGQSRGWSWQRLGRARIAQFLWPDILITEQNETSETQRLRAFAHLTPAAALGVLLGALGCVVMLWDAEHAWITKVWIACFVLVVGVRVAYARRTRRRLVTKTALPGDVANLMVLSIAFGILWGALLLAVPHLDSSHDAVLPVVFVGACVMSGALTTYFVVPGASPTYASLVGLPLIYAGASHSAVIGVLAAVYTAWTVVSAMVHERLYTDSVDRMQALLAERDKLDTALEAGPTGAVGWLWRTDSELRLRDIDPAFADAHDVEPDTLNGRAFIDLFSEPQHRPASGPLAALAVTLSLRKTFHGVRLVSHDGIRLRYWEISGAPRFDDDGQFVGYQGVCGEVAQARPAPSPLDDYADDLTGLPPLWALRPRIEEALIKAQHGRSLCAATLITLDGLDRVPKSAQHRATVLLIAEAAFRIRALAGKSEIAYLGSGRFLLFCESFLRVDELIEHAGNVVARLSGRYDLDGAGQVEIRALGGVALGPVESASPTILLEQANSALDEAHREPDGVHIYRRHATRPVASVDELRAGLHAALRNNAVSPRYSLVLDIVKRQPVSVSVDLLWESARFGTLDSTMIRQVAADVVSQRWISDYLIGRILSSAWPIVGAANLCVDATFLDFEDAGLKSKLTAVVAAAREPQARLEVIVDASMLHGPAVVAAADLAGPGVLVGLRSIDQRAPAGQLIQAVSSVWFDGAAIETAETLDRATALFPNARRLVAEGVESIDRLETLAALGFTAFAGLPPLTSMTAEEALAFTQPARMPRPVRPSKLAG